MRTVRGAVVLVLLSFYLIWVFRLTDDSFWRLGLGDWMDPYFTNALVEHWYQSLLTFSDPSSPPMYYPVRHTLGYSHGLILFAPFYVVTRPFLHPFTAHSVMLLLVMATGTICLYAVLRRHRRLSFLEALLLTTFFATSRNVTNGEVGVWLQRASIFLIPPILLILLAASGMRNGALKVALAFIAGLLSTLMFTQDFQTALFAVLLSAPFAVMFLAVTGRRMSSPRGIWTSDSSPVRRAIAVATLLAATWTVIVVAIGGVSWRILGVTIRSTNWRRPFVLALAGAVALVVLYRDAVRRLLTPIKKWQFALASGVLLGVAVFVWIYLPGYREHHAFPEQDLLNLLIRRDPDSWQGPWDILHGLAAYRSMRSFVLVFLVGVLLWLPPFRTDRIARLYALVAVLISCVVIVLPIRFGGFSVWRTFFWPIPGLAAIRDPSRIIPIYELGVVLGAAGLMIHVRSIRGLLALLVLILTLANWNPERFDYVRSTADFDKWIAAPIQVDQACRSFFIKEGPPEYLARRANSRTLYGIDALFFALRYGIPTLNGYSAWAPNNWDVAVPEDPAYNRFAREWIARHRLSNVCQFDVHARTMTLFE